MKLSQKRRKTAINNNLYQLFKFESDDCRRSRTRKGTELRNAHYGLVCAQLKTSSGEYRQFEGYVDEDRKELWNVGWVWGEYCEWNYPIKKIKYWWYVLRDGQTRKEAHREVEIGYVPLRGKKRRRQ